MKLAVVANTDGNFNIHSEHGDEQGAFMEFHGYCRALWAEKSVLDATVMIQDEHLNCYDGKFEHITHPQTAEQSASNVNNPLVE